ncbi:type IV pilus assembly protein [[Clostridium] sordellii]|uniref:GspE/PulE family protein n=1 Tax=Paraclostridium sordellii TaxID=1505 RepID=UPI0005E0E499|nr:GspE/PulE family protein [Paeniclostridium sordellii]MCH1964719.1 GspE/PulE family protein [Paeniclostridium sordellii]MDU2149219.1 GspE/PulE family protein [Paeniclostridium sordellii]CEN26059.1 type IV pilus assembly protein [[Clostridium] sordellii] [Paeniclostridium sordellii]CEP47111.1 type IV pilus assembly protein [[Clostridium] sordellii] [Paeniclostridium sordellii]CEP91955.1 type IV pilus assembly protein [[Clostridium] sordellii] [Paeniclostridium sordellii]
MSQKVRIGDKLVEKGYISREQLERALKLQNGTGKRIGEILIEQGIITPELLTSVLTELLDIENISLTRSNINPDVIKLIPENICRRYKIFPFKIEGNKLLMAMADPQDRQAMQDAKRISGLDIIPYIATMGQVNQAIEIFYSNADLDKALKEYSDSGVLKEESILEDDINSAPIVRLVHNILETAVRMKASDIHIERDGDFMRIRFRIDGILSEYMKMNSRPYKAVISRVKIMAGLNISEKRLPQDGRIFLNVDNRSIDYRVSTMPTSKDEKVVMRVLDRTTFMVSKEKLGLNKKNIQVYDELLENPYGLILVVGPTGSGKTTTLYAMLNQLNSIEKNILTIEDPVEYELDGINQSQINYKAGLDFANALRAFLRQDPDIIMVGEIRDLDTAQIGIRAALTGHLVLSTLHSNTAVSAISRLLDMKVDSFLITSALTGVVSQRLVRKVCENCKTSYLAEEGEKKALNYPLDKELILYKGSGCDKCNYTGYKGRTGVYEILKITKSVRDLINRGATEADIQKKAEELGMETMRKDATIKVINGETTIEEMLRVTFITD